MFASRFQVAAYVLLSFGGCSVDGDQPSEQMESIQACSVPSPSLRYSDWSTPTNAGAPINTLELEFPNGISRDGLSLYFQRGNAAISGEDLYVVHRRDTDADWGAPVALPPTINTSANERGAFVSKNGHWLYFASNRAGGLGDYDLYVSWRTHVHDDLAWQPAVNLRALNTPGFESGPALLEDVDSDLTQLYYVSNPGPGGQALADIYVSVLGRHGAFGTPELVTELNSPASEGRPYLRRDGREIFFQSNRAGGFGAFDIWTSTRATVDDPWSPPVNVSALNTSFGDVTPVLSWDGETLFMGVNRPENGDVFYSTRERLHGAR
jgi:hypothetical protein